MSHKEKPLPRPSSTPFTRKKGGEHREDHESLTADRMAQAMAEGKLDEFIKQEMPDNEYARNLSNMMMGMTGMMPMAGMPAAAPPVEPQPSATAASTEQELPVANVPQEVLENARKAIEGGDVKSLMGLLQQEHRKR